MLRVYRSDGSGGTGGSRTKGLLGYLVLLGGFFAMTRVFAGGGGALPGGSGPPKPPVQRVGEQFEAERDSRGRPNLCSVADIIVIAPVEGSESRSVDAKYAKRVFTLSTLRVDSVIRGPIVDGDKLDFDIEGGEADGIRETVSGNPPFSLGEQFILFRQSVDQFPGPIIQGYYRWPSDILLPPQEALRSVWATTCAAHPEGIYYLGPRVHLVIPKGLVIGALANGVLGGDRVELQGVP